MCWREHPAEREVAASRSYHLSVPDEPLPKARARVTKTGHTFTPTRTQQAEWRIREHAARIIPEPLTGPIALRIEALLTPPKMPRKWQGIRRPTKRPDLDNYMKTVLDALNGVAYLDDAQVVTTTGTKDYAWRTTSGWRVGIYELEERDGSGNHRLPGRDG